MLVLDDNAGIRNIFVDRLGTQIEILQAETPDEALDYLENCHIDLAVLDGELQEGCGWDTLRLIKEPDNWPQLPVVFTSIYKDPEWALRAWAYSGGNGIYYVVKPFFGWEVCGLISQVLNL